MTAYFITEGPFHHALFVRLICVFAGVRAYEQKQQGVLFTITILTSAITVIRSLKEMFETPNVDFKIQSQLHCPSLYIF